MGWVWRNTVWKQILFHHLVASWVSNLLSFNLFIIKIEIRIPAHAIALREILLMCIIILIPTV
jgi:hypothetical protein